MSAVDAQHEQGSGPAVDLDNVCFGYGRREVIHNVSLRVEPGQMVAMVGPNGGGKTTLLRLILGLLQPRHGTVRLLGGNPRTTRSIAGYVPQHLQFDRDFPVSVRDVVLMGRLHRVRIGPYRRADHRAAERALEQVGMEAAGRSAFAELSGGQRQRVLIAQALASEPEILLLDEPTASVDSMAERAIFELLHALNRECTILLVSHNLNVVTSHVSHVVCVNRTAAMHPIEALEDPAAADVHGHDLRVLVHDLHCHVMDASAVMQRPHRNDDRAEAPS